MFRKNYQTWNQSLATRLPRSLSSLETWGFGLTGLLLWTGAAPGAHAELGPQAICVWLPGAIVGMLINLQVQRLGMRSPEMSGGTPNYMTRLLKHYPGIARYGAIGYFISWVAVLPVSAIILTDLIKVNLNAVGLDCPETLLRIGFTGIAFIVAFSGTRALGILHVFFVVPAVGLLLAFCIQGMGWLAFSPASPGFFPPSWPSFNFALWAKWFIIAAYAVYACETASSFVADSQRPDETLRCLPFTAWLIPPVYLGGSWVLMRLATEPGLKDDTFLNLLATAKPFWGQSAAFLVTFLIVSGCLLSCATAASNCPRILYQLARDGHLAPVFAVSSRQGVLGPSLVLTFLLSLVCLVWGNVPRIAMVTGVGWLASFIAFHWGLWLRRRRQEVLLPWWSLGFCVVETVILFVGGWAWNWQDLLMGLVLPLAILAGDAAIRRIRFAPLHPSWWIERYRQRSSHQVKDFVAFQVIILMLLVSSTTAIAWLIRDKFTRISTDASSNLLVVLLMTITFVAIAIACWTSLPQVTAIAEAREQAENLFITALDTVPDTILVVDERGVICQTNPAAQSLFQMKTDKLVGYPLQKLISGLADTPDKWPHTSEQILRQEHTDSPSYMIEATISQRSNRNVFEYIVILRDITARKQEQITLQQSEARSRQQAQQLEQAIKELRRTQTQLIQTEKMSSLGQLVAGVAHEINNPVNFIHGNLNYVNEYSNNLLTLIDLYQQHYPNTVPVVEEYIQEIDLNFLLEDLPKILSSMKVGSERIRQIVLTLRNFSRLDESEMKPVNIHEGIDSTLLILQNRLKATSDYPAIKIIKNYENLPEIECYAGQLNQAFMHLISNAIDSLRSHDKNRSLEAKLKQPSTITISTQILDNNRIGISIKDNGLGINEAVKSRLFDPFFTTKPVGEGTGLGLSITYQIIVNKHDGRLECISEVGEGAEFWLEIPVKQKPSLSF